MKTLDQAPITTGTRVLLRADFNVAIQNGKVVDDFRIRKTLSTLDFLKNKGAKVVIVSHIDGVAGSKDKPTLRPVVEVLNTLGFPCTFAETIESAENISLEKAEQDGASFTLLENIRNYQGETANDPVFAKQLAVLGDIYVNDAFSVSHRTHASIVGVPKLLPHFAGFQLALEVENLSKAFNPSHPFLFILGGAKFDTKLPLVQRFLDKVDNIFIGGALANDLFKAKGYEIGLSLVSSSKTDFGELISNKKIMLPVDVVVLDNGKKKILEPDKVGKEGKILDAGPQTLALFKEKINTAKFILWNGPLGNYENGYKEATHEVAEMIAGVTHKYQTPSCAAAILNDCAGDSPESCLAAKTAEINSNSVESIVGGGDTLAAITELKQTNGESLENSFTFVSTGGGAMLDFLARGTLPGIEALK